MIARARPWAAVLAAATLAACGSGPGADRATALREIAPCAVAQRTGGAAARPAEIGPAERAAALEATTRPLLYTRFSATGAPAILIGIEESGPATTFATRARQTIALRDGVLIATRGLGGDLMSSDVAAVQALIAARRAGAAQRVMRFLNAADEVRALAFDCRVTPGAAQRVTVGGRARTATLVVESCTGRDGREIVNTYMIDSAGRAVASRQWAGDLIGHVTLRVLRF